MRQQLVAGVMWSAALAVATPAFADPIIVANRSGIAVLAAASQDGTTDRQSYPYVQDGNNAVARAAVVGDTMAAAYASILSDVSNPLRLSGIGSTAMSFNTANGRADASGSSTFSVDLEVTSPYTYHFDAEFFTSEDARADQTGYERSQWLVNLWRDGIFLINEAGVNTTTMSRSGVLTPGIYRLVVDAGSIGLLVNPGQSMGAAFSNFGFTFDLTALDDEQPAPTPEPATLLLLGSGLGGVIAARRRRAAARV